MRRSASCRGRQCSVTISGSSTVGMVYGGVGGRRLQMSADSECTDWGTAR